MSYCHRILAVLLPALFLMMAVSARADESAIKRATDLLKSGQAEAAYELLAPLESQLSGNAQFDYLLGVAALDSNRVEVAVFALERVVAMVPGEAYAHADLGRALLALGEKDAARRELQEARRLSRSVEASALLAQRLNALDEVDLNGGKWLSAHLDYAVGYDSNMNRATSSRQIVIPAFGGFSFSLGDASVKASSAFSQWGGALAAQHRFNEQSAAFFHLAGSQRTYANQGRFDTDNLDYALGLNHRHDRHSFVLALQESNYTLNGSDYRKTYGFSGQWQVQLSPSAQAGMFAQGSKLVYATAPLRNADRYVLGLFGGTVLNLPLAPLLYASVYTGSEIPSHSGYSFVGNQITGLRLGSELSLTPSLQLYAGLAHEKRDYGGVDPLFLKGRTDQQFELDGGVILRLEQGFSLRPALSYIRNDSNVQLNKFDRLELSFNVRKEF